MKTKFLIIFSLAILIFAIVSGGFYVYQSRYTYASPKKGKIVEAVYAQGKVKTDKVYELKLGHTATVKKYFVEEGQDVKVGDKLIIVLDQTFESPIDGKVTAKGAYPNETVAPNLPLIRVENLEHRYLEVSLEQKAALRVKTGLKCRVIFESLRRSPYEGVVSSIYSRQEEFIARIDVTDLQANILPGMTADLAIEVGEKDDALLIPLSSIVNGKVTIKDSGSNKKKVAVKIGKVDGQWAEVIEGDIKTTDQVLIQKEKK